MNFYYDPSYGTVKVLDYEFWVSDYDSASEMIDDINKVYTLSRKERNFIHGLTFGSEIYGQEGIDNA